MHTRLEGGKTSRLDDPQARWKFCTEQFPIRIEVLEKRPPLMAQLEANPADVVELPKQGVRPSRGARVIGQYRERSESIMSTVSTVSMRDMSMMSDTHGKRKRQESLSRSPGREEDPPPRRRRPNTRRPLPESDDDDLLDSSEEEVEDSRVPDEELIIYEDLPPQTGLPAKDEEGWGAAFGAAAFLLVIAFMVSSTR